MFLKGTCKKWHELKEVLGISDVRVLQLILRDHLGWLDAERAKLSTAGVSLGSPLPWYEKITSLFGRKQY